MGSIYFNSGNSNSLNSSFDLGMSAINAARLAMHTIGHNIANVNTPGFSRQNTILATRTPQNTAVGAIGRGVDAVKIEAARDKFIEAQLAFENQEYGRLTTKSTLLDRLESIFNPSSSLGLADAADNLFGGFQDLAGNPENIAQRESLLKDGQGMVASNNHVVDQLKGIKSSINSQIDATINEVNAVLEKMASLNVKIAGNDQLGLSLEDVVDERNRLLRDLNGLMEVQSYENESSELTVTTPNGKPLVIGNQYATLRTTPSAQDATSTDIIVEFNSSPANITKLIQGGTLGALLETRDQIVNDALSNQRLFASLLADAVNIEHRLGTDLSGNQGGDFFSNPYLIVDNSVGANINNIAQVGDNAAFEVNYSTSANATSGVNITDITIDLANINDLTKHDYTIRFNGPAAGDYEVFDQKLEAVVSTGNLPGAGTITYAGLSVDFDGQPNIGDSYELNFEGRDGLTGDVYNIVWTSATDYEVYNVSDQSTTPLATGTLAGNGLIFFDGLAVEVSGARVAGDEFKIDYARMEVDPNLTAATVAASGSAAGLSEPGNNENALRLADLGLENFSGLNNSTFSIFQGTEIAAIGSEKSSNEILANAQGNFITSLDMQRESISGVSLDEEAAELVRFQQAYVAGARYLTQVNDLLDFLISTLGR